MRGPDFRFHTAAGDVVIGVSQARLLRLRRCAVWLAGSLSASIRGRAADYRDIRAICFSNKSARSRSSVRPASAARAVAPVSCMTSIVWGPATGTSNNKCLRRPEALTLALLSPYFLIAPVKKPRLARAARRIRTPGRRFHIYRAFPKLVSGLGDLSVSGLARVDRGGDLSSPALTAPKELHLGRDGYVARGTS